MQYLFLVYRNESHWAAIPETEKIQMWDECDHYGHQLVQGGHFRHGSSLGSDRNSVKIRRLPGQSEITVDPCTQTQEVLAGYHLVECRDLDEAIGLSANFPGLNYGFTIEVRALLVA